METDRITVTGCRPGHPVLIRISYHPRWKATTGERVWLAAPSFMLVVPKGERIELYFDGGWPVTFGHLLTAAGCLNLPRRRAPGPPPRCSARCGPSSSCRPSRRGRARPDHGRLVGADAGRGAGRRARGLRRRIRPCGSGRARHRRGRHLPAGADLYGARAPREAVPFFERARRLAPLSMSAIHSTVA